jgi:thiamine-monophosphate kinase
MPDHPQQLTDLGENALIRRLTRHLPVSAEQVELGAGDDCALLPSPDPTKWQLFKTDCLVEDVHFTRDTPPAQVGRKAVARTVSDFAAMAGRPSSFLITAVLPKDLALDYAEGLFQGMGRAAREFQISAAGGETSSSPGGIMLSIAMLGEVRKERCVPRSGGKPGDAVFVTGRLGHTLAGHHLQFQPRLEEAEWLSANFPIHAMMDLSDGVGADLPRLARASGLGYHVTWENLPCRDGASPREALEDGEDYELLFTLPAAQAARLQKRWQDHFTLELTRIGRLTEPTTNSETHEGSQRSGGFDHFAQP